MISLVILYLTLFSDRTRILVLPKKYCFCKFFFLEKDYT